MIRIETALSNTAARLWDAIETRLDPYGRPKDKVAEQVAVAGKAIQGIQQQAVAAWKEGHFQNLSSDERLKTGATWVETAKVALSQAQTEVDRLPRQPGSAHLDIGKVIAAQQARLDGVLKEHHEHERLESSRAIHNGQQTFELAKDLGAAFSLGKPLPAEVQSGAYRGAIVEITNSSVVQRISTAMAVVHQKQRLDSVPIVGESASIRYSGGVAVVKALAGPERGSELGR
jgi:hypothetical protein